MWIDLVSSGKLNDVFAPMTNIHNTGDTWDTVVTVSSGGQWCQLYQFNLSNLNFSQSVWCWQLILKYHFITYHLQHLKIFQHLTIFKESEAKIFKLQSHFQFYPGQSSTLFSFCFCFQTNLYGQSASFQFPNSSLFWLNRCCVTVSWQRTNVNRMFVYV